VSAHAPPDTIRTSAESTPEATSSARCWRAFLLAAIRAISRCCAGGGYGDPLERDPARVAKDVSERMISRERAYASYGVVLDRGGAVDRTATESRRTAMRSTKEAPAGTT